MAGIPASPPSPPPVKPPRTVKQTRETSGLLMSVIRTLSASETNEQRDREKAKLEKEYKKCDQKLDELVSIHDAEITQVMQIFSTVCGVVGACRARIRGVRSRLLGCKQLLRWRRNDLRRLCGEAAQHRHALVLLNQIEKLTKVGTEMNTYLSKGHYLNAATVLKTALVAAQTELCQVEALQHLRTDLESKRLSLYDQLLGQINIALYQINPEDCSLKRQNSSRRPELPKLVSCQSEDGVIDVTPQFESDLSEENKNFKINLTILIEAMTVIGKTREMTESIKVHMQTELLNVISKTSQYILDFGSNQLPLTQTLFAEETNTVESVISKKNKQETQNALPLVELISLLLIQWRMISERHEVFLEILKHCTKKHTIPGVSLYTMQQYWGRVQAVVQLLLTDYLDIQSLKSGPQRMMFSEQPANVDVNSYFVKKKTQNKKKCRLFKFSGSAVEAPNPSLEREGAAAAGYKLVCSPAPEHLTHIYHVLDDFMCEIESQTENNECSLRLYLGELIRGAQGERAGAQLLEQINEFCSEPAAWRELTVIPLTSTKNKTLFKCGVQSWEACVYSLNNWIRLGDIGARAARTALSPALIGLATAARKRATYLAPRARSYAWRTDNDITRFLKSLPNWMLLKNPSKGKTSQNAIQDMQQGFEREAEILGSSLVDGNVSEKEIIGNIITLKDIAIMCETMEWLCVKITNWKNNSKMSLGNDLKVNGVSNQTNARFKNSGSLDALLAELTHTAATFEEISDNCLLLLHLEVRIQCFYYLGKLGNFLGLTLQPPPSTTNHIVPESPATSLARILHSFSEHVAPVLHHRRRNYVMEGLGEMMSAVIVGSWRVGGSAAVGSVASQLEPLRHCLTAAQISPDGLHKAALYLQMLTMTHEEILSMVSDKGVVFSELEYMNAFQVIAKSSKMADSTLKANLNKLSNILGNIGVTV